MKKTFTLTHDTIKYPRLVEAVKHEVKKYLKRERNKALPKGVDFWDFDCRFGTTEAEAAEIHVSQINKSIDQVAEQQLESFYLEILAKAGIRTKRDAVWGGVDESQGEADEPVAATNSEERGDSPEA
ncbi:DUF6172 family protein [Aestuariirhabdus sp. LZHN29]|uniref:DUF6172 family protein n=1 Tax=Aestuariirhabdus sp. LZHN29 TaxID=3417462 RepID=UPI003CF51CC8